MADIPNDPAALAQRYWGLWADALREGSAGLGFDVGKQGFDEALNLWTRQAGIQGGFGGLLERFQGQCRDWYGQMQQVASQFAGRDHRAHDVAEAWRAAFGGGHPFDSLMQGLRGPGLENIARWSEAAAPWLDGLRTQALGALGMPAFGFTREHQERLQALGKAQLRMQDAQRGYDALLAKVSQQAFVRFESKLAEHEEPGRQIGSVRALFDLWVDAAEEAWADAALSKDYRHAFGELANAQMQLRNTAQAIAEKAAQAWGVPGRSELDGAYRRLAQLERDLRAMNRSDSTAQPEAAARPTPAKPAARKPAKKQVAKSAATRAASQPAAKKAALPARKSARPTAARKPLKPTTKRGKPAARKR